MKWEDLISPGFPRGVSLRVRMTVRGRVQGVGFRPTVYRYAVESSLTGFVRNTRRGVVIEVEGTRRDIDTFGKKLIEEPPPLARIEEVNVERITPVNESAFTVMESEERGRGDVIFPVDTAVCHDCLREMRTPGDRRFKYPFITCTNCGPRFTIIGGLPYDRALTTMSEFELCEFCRRQYEDPADRRFHAEPVSCPLCGPELYLIDTRGKEIPGDPVEVAADMLREGYIVAVKGLGGYHLACRADDAGVVGKLRKRKKRPVKPFAVMFRDIVIVSDYCKVNEQEKELLLSPEAPIVLLRKSDKLLAGVVAPGNGYIGAFLPYTPLHHMLMESFPALVMTSANFSEEPLISMEDELSGIMGVIADAAITHNRRIAHKCDDSIFFVPSKSPVPIRRARGFVPEPIRLTSGTDRVILALGAHEKSTFAVTRGNSVFISPHLGDLSDYRSQANFRVELEEFLEILGVSPDVVVYDMHPDYFTSRYGRGMEVSSKLAVQHHHAHAASVMAEHALAEPVVAVSFDGTGYGRDGKLWGGDFLLADRVKFERIAHLKYLPLAGGELAIRQPWRMALIHLWNLFGDGVLEQDFPGRELFDRLPAEEVIKLAGKGINSPLTSSMGRLFDSVAVLVGCQPTVSYEAEAAVALEDMAVRAKDGERYYRFELSGDRPVIIDPAPVIEGVIRDLINGTTAEDIAAAFHRSVSRMIMELVVKLLDSTGCSKVVYSGGVFQNRILCESVMQIFEANSIDYYQHYLVPPNDGGVCLGQAQIGVERILNGLI
jgi:hydrogenase maturation protein HypF